ncbi:branched-chain amino acid aminotransferase/4-amino-4-deoxychorismate lyase [Brachybacterium faecium DSM 4810]|uniref:Branched-chain amino acid aminotransferase/4-amino-4-deoxychorismate lyase n=1 Tax=Brachybacterium faecium (strain ATCC 43885 / DSM 4810 / JCM 11609 / LMG 19847 / NBRC 14762 / NCIMB 9860 / 6-10) TaxID=446465 RepID=C7MGR4_BRAFD|nr:aminodeoxychorismate lyase [Brachybacterium faecium]ACU84255.1 branched-chain amino acid aminotransferase/4-amino-4-deoxychorismate lyase [Brachybacterium faecium DSM 4810]HJG52543.1 aminodeoxychorismate lyase [Brachybacterium faecium]
MPSSSPAALAPVLVLVPGATGAPADGGPRFHLADATVPQLSVTDLVATRGDGVFETIGAFDGVPVNVGPHLERLARSADLVDLPAPDLATLAEAVDAAISAHDPVAELSVRVMLTRGIEGAGVPTCWIHARVSDDWTPYRAGMRVAALDRGLPTTVAETSPWLLPGAKTLSYAVNMAAVREAKRRGAADVLFVASDGYVLEGPTSTLLVRRGDTFLTTPASAGVLPGTSVKSLFTWLQEQEGRTVREELMTLADVTGSDGAWLLSSTRLAAPLTHLDDTELPVDHELTARFERVLKGQA